MTSLDLPYFAIGVGLIIAIWGYLFTGTETHRTIVPEPNNLLGEQE